MSSPRHKSFADEDTHYALERSDTPVNVDGFKLGEPTGVVICEACENAALNVDEIPHAKDCPQRFARSDWWYNTYSSEDITSPCDSPVSLYESGGLMLYSLPSYLIPDVSVIVSIVFFALLERDEKLKVAILPSDSPA